MREQLNNHFTELVPASAVSAQVGYTTDYITKLARDGKIVAEKIGRQWHVDVDTLKKFIERSNIERAERSARIRGERMMELEAHREILLPEQSRFEVLPGRMYAIAQATFVLLFALTFGAFSYYQPNQAQLAQIGLMQTSVLEHWAVSFYHFITPNGSSFAVGGQDTNGKQQTRSYDVVTLPDNTFDQRAIVGDAFSDSVDVRFDTEISEDGIITPRFKEGGDSEYRFRLMIEELKPKAQGG